MAFQRIESQWSALPRGIWLALSFIAVPLIALAAIELDQLLWRRPALRLGHEQVVRSLDALAAAQQVENAMQDAERGQRGFLLTGDPAYLQPYRNGIAQVPATLKKLRELTAGEPAQQPRVAELGEQIEQKLAELKSTLDARERGGAGAALSIMRTNAGLDSMRRITWLIGEITSTENALMADREAGLESARRATE